MKETKLEASSFRQVLSRQLSSSMLFAPTCQVFQRRKGDLFKLVAKCREALNATSPFMVWWAQRSQASVTSTHTIRCETIAADIKLKIWDAMLHAQIYTIEATIARECCLEDPGQKTCICPSAVARINWQWGSAIEIENTRSATIRSNCVSKLAIYLTIRRRARVVSMSTYIVNEAQPSIANRRGRVV